MDSSEYEQELRVACTAVQHCAVLTNRLQKSLRQENSVQKSDFSPVTIGDYAVQALLTCAMHDAFPEDAYLAEESADELRTNEALLDQVWQLVESVKPAFAQGQIALRTPGSKEDVLELIDFGGKNERSDGRRTWVFDPIDGTATFMTGQQYAINCAFLVNGREEIGILGCPNFPRDSNVASEDVLDNDGLGTQIFATRGHGTWSRSMHSNGILAEAERVERHGDTATLDRLIWSDSSTYTSTILTLHQQIAAKLNTQWPGVDLFSSLMKYASLSLNRSHIVMRIFKYGSWRSNIWDHAGGVLIFEEVGGKVSDLDGRALDFTRGRKISENRGLVCAPRSVHAEVLATAQDAIKSYPPIPWSK